MEVIEFDPCNQNPDHEQVAIEHPDAGRPIFVDVGIADLLQELWRRQVYTKFSCQGHLDRKGRYWRNGYIMFSSAMSFERFVALVRFDDESLRTQAAGLGEFVRRDPKGRIRTKPDPMNWQWEASPTPWEDAPWEMGYVVRFPPEHVELLLKHLRKSPMPIRYSSWYETVSVPAANGPGAVLRHREDCKR